MLFFFPYEIGVSFCTQLLSGGSPFYSLFLSLPPEGLLLSLINYHRVFGICCKGRRRSCAQSCQGGIAGIAAWLSFRLVSL